MSVNLNAAVEILGHSDFSIRNGNKVFLDETDSPVSDDIQTQIEELAEKMAVKTLDQHKEEALASLDQKHAEILRNLTGNATIEERDTWQSKALAASAIQDGSANPYQLDMIGTEAALSKVTVEELVTKILTKNAAFMKMIGLAAGHRTATREAIKSAPDISTLGLVLEKANQTSEQMISDFLQAIQNG